MHKLFQKMVHTIAFIAALLFADQALSPTILPDNEPVVVAPKIEEPKVVVKEIEEVKPQETERPQTEVKVEWFTDLRLARLEAKKLNRLVFIDYDTTGCLQCMRVKKGSYENSKIKYLLTTKYIPVHLTVTQENNSWANQWNPPVTRFPAAIVVLLDGHAKRFTPSADPSVFLTQLEMNSK